MDIIQFANNTSIIEGGGWKNLWIIRSILRGFELVPILNVNFYKSRLIGINVSNHFLAAA